MVSSSSAFVIVLKKQHPVLKTYILCL